MALPTTAFTRSVTTPKEYVRVSGTRQKRPFNLILPYESKSSRARLFNYPTNPNYTLADNVFTAENGQPSLEVNQAKSLAYEKLKGAISDRASMGENLGQLGSSARLIADKAAVIRDAIKRLRRFDVSAFAQWMDRGFVKRNSRFAAQLTLEINFAIAPSINDIFSCVEILQNPIKSTMVRGRATVPYQRRYTSNGSGTIDLATWSGKASAEYGALIAISNPNLFLANAMGVINPVQTAWQLLPGSFLVDWLIPVEQFLGAATDMLGLRVEQSYSTWFVRGTYYEHWSPYGWNGSCDWHWINRTPGISLPSLALRPLKVPSLKRAANAVSLAIQAFYK